MKRVVRISVFYFVLSLLVSLSYLTFADENKADNNSEGLILRPVIEYSSGDLRDPFMDLYQLSLEKQHKTDGENVQVSPDDTVTKKPLPDLKKFKVQGVIWGGKLTQVIINNKILSVGDTIDDAEIVSIGKKVIVLNFSGTIVNLATTGITPDSEKGDKEEK